MPEIENMDCMTNRELELVSILRKNVSDLNLDPELEGSDENLIRWIRARDLNLTKSESMLRENVKWRAVNEINLLLDEWKASEVIIQTYHYQITGVTLQGSSVIISRLGDWDLKKIIEIEGSKMGTLKYTYQIFEKALKINSNKMKNFIVVLDMGNLTMSKLGSIAAIDAMLTVNREFEKNWPEILKACVVIKAPWIFSHFFKLVQPILSKRTLGKVEIFSNSDLETKWKNRLGQLIPENLLPVEYGGCYSQ